MLEAAGTAAMRIISVKNGIICEKTGVSVHLAEDGDAGFFLFFLAPKEEVFYNKISESMGKTFFIPFWQGEKTKDSSFQGWTSSVLMERMYPMDDISQAIHRFLVQDFNQVLRWEEKVLSSYQQGKLSVNEFHIIEAVFLAMDAGLNNMGEISRRLGVTMGTLTTAVKTLETKGFLTRRKRQEDRRMVWLYPTHVAEEANRYHQMFHERLVSGVMDCLDHQQLLALVSALEVLAQWFTSLEQEERYIQVENLLPAEE